MGFGTRGRWKKMLVGSDLELAAAFLNQQFAGTRIPAELAGLINQFVDEPNEANAIALLEFDPAFFLHFDSAKEGGLVTRLPRLPNSDGDSK